MFITVLDYSVAEVTQYEFINEPEFDDVEKTLKDKGHRLKDIYYMVHDNDSINKIQIKD